MGALCCCFHVHDAPDDNASNNSSSNDCSCPKCFFHKLLNKQRSQLNGGQQIRTGQQTRTVSPPNHQASSSNAEVIFYASSRHSGAAHNRDAPDNDSTRLLQEQSRQEKAINRSRVQPEPVGQSRIQMNPKSTQGDKIVVSTSEVETQEKNSQSSEEVEYSFLSLHEVEECPTCLEEYTEENPKIIAKCSHHFHLSCIYEWMERSQECPVCRELMLFDE